MIQAKATVGQEKYLTQVATPQNTIIVDEPVELGGQDKGFSPFDLIAGALASCTAITLRMYANHKAINTGEITVDVQLDTQTKGTAAFSRTIYTQHPIDEHLQKRFIAIANACPTHKLLSSTVTIETHLGNTEQKG